MKNRNLNGRKMFSLWKLKRNIMLYFEAYLLFCTRTISDLRIIHLGVRKWGMMHSRKGAPVMENLEAWLVLRLLIRTHRSQNVFFKSERKEAKGFQMPRDLGEGFCSAHITGIISSLSAEKSRVFCFFWISQLLHGGGKLERGIDLLGPPGRKGQAGMATSVSACIYICLCVCVSPGPSIFKHNLMCSLTQLGILNFSCSPFGCFILTTENMRICRIFLAQSYELF